MIDLKYYCQYISRFRVADCVVGGDQTLCFILCEDQTQWPDYNEGDPPANAKALEQRILSLNPNVPEKQGMWIVERIKGRSRLVVGRTLIPDTGFLAMSITGDAYTLANSLARSEPQLPYDPDGLRSIITRIKLIGKRTYVCGDERLVGVKQGVQHWEWITQDVPFDDDDESYVEQGFQDIDGFDEDDIYAVGGDGDVWHYDGNEWNQIDFPTNDIVKRVCCADNGYVYISDYECGIYEGRGDSWKKVVEPELSLSFKDIIWYQDRLWCTSDYGLWWFYEGKLVEADVGYDVKVCSGHLSVYGDTLLLAGYFGAAYLKGGRWEVLFHSDSMEEACDEKGLSRPPILE